LRFIKGVVILSDLPLNISRQRLQQDRHITQIHKWMTRKVLGALTEVKEKEPEKYLKFWGQFRESVERGSQLDYDNKERLLPLLLLESSNDPISFNHPEGLCWIE